MLHGRGASAQSIIGLADVLDTTGLSILAPEAEGNVWYPQSFLAPREANQEGIDAAFAVIDGIIDELAAAGVDRAHTVLLGFSQGACLTSDYVFNHPDRFGGVIALSGGLIGPPGTEFRPVGDLEGTPVFLGCSDVDPHIPAERVRETHEAFTQAGAAAEMQLYPGLPHTVNAEEIARATEMLRAVRS
jgi:predicted esterase